MAMLIYIRKKYALRGSRAVSEAMDHTIVGSRLYLVESSRAVRSAMKSYGVPWSGYFMMRCKPRGLFLDAIERRFGI